MSNLDQYKLAKWLHDSYEVLAKANDWQTQKSTRVEFDDLPIENKQTMLALADKMLNAFIIKEKTQETDITNNFPEQLLKVIFNPRVKSIRLIKSEAEKCGYSVNIQYEKSEEV